MVTQNRALQYLVCGVVGVVVVADAAVAAAEGFEAEIECDSVGNDHPRIVVYGC